MGPPRFSLLSLLLLGCGPDAPLLEAPPPDPVDLRADSNRDGTVDFDVPSEDDELLGGAIVLANLDDDLVRCPRRGKDLELALCHDAADEIVNGSDDALDLAPMKTRPFPGAPDGATGEISISPAGKARLFLLGPSGWTLATRLDAEQLRAGVDLGVEALDIVRDPSWDGLLEVTFTVAAGAEELGRDQLQLRVAPVILSHHLEPVELAFVTRFGDPESRAFVNAIKPPVAEIGSGLRVFSDEDPWTQDLFENGYMSMPAPGGRQHVMRVVLRAASQREGTEDNPLRPAAAVVFSAMRGRDLAAIQHFDPGADPENDSLNSTGNFETVPPYGEHPLGRMLWGSSEQVFPDRRFTALLQAQRVQPPIHLDTSWLAVGHVDETLSFLKARTPRGWVLLVNDPAMAREMLLREHAEGRGSVQLFAGKEQARTVDEVLADTRLMAASAESAVAVGDQLAVMIRETELQPEEIVRVPFLHERTEGYSLAYQPGTVNALVLNDSQVVMADPFGPTTAGVDPFKRQLEDALRPFGYAPRFVDDWIYHLGAGEVHCGTNSQRAIPSHRWWEGGR
jgi:protein-arginine deiminase